jgi:hypothetical protein
MKQLLGWFLMGYFLALGGCGQYTDEREKKSDHKPMATITKPTTILGFGDAETMENVPTLSSQLLHSSLALTGQAKDYLVKIEKFYQQNPSTPLGKSLLIDRYKNLFNKMFDNHIKNSLVGLYYYADEIKDDDLLKCPLNLSFLKNSLIVNQATKEPYHYEPHKAYVDFANRFIGGGVMQGGLVQEEIMLLESTFLPFVAESRLQGATPLNFAPKIPLDSLDKLPVVLKFRLFNQINIYGNVDQVIDKAAASSAMVARGQGVDIYAPAMAAPDLATQSSYSEELLQKMFYVAMRAFYTTLLAQQDEHHPLEIHTGNWGAGVFGNSLYVSWAIQRLAAEVAYIIFIKTKNSRPEFKYFHDAYDERSLAAINEASQMLVEKMETYASSSAKPLMTAKEVIALIFALSKEDAKWQVGYKIR